VQKVKATKKKKRPIKPPKPFSRAASLDYAALALARPPTRKFVARVEPVGELVVQFVLPEALCLTTNRRKNLHWTKVAELKKSILSMLFTQHGFRKPARPLPGRPQVLVTRFTATRPDTGAGWEKDAIDALLTSKVVARKGGVKQRKGLGLIEDDSDAHIDRHVWWESGPRDGGFVLLRVFGGAK
jgi:hypothetical protein